MCATEYQSVNTAPLVQTQTAGDRQSIAHQTQQPVSRDYRSGRSQPGSPPDQHIVPQAPQPQQHRLRRKALLIATPQALLILLKSALNAAAAPVIEMCITQKHRRKIALRLRPRKREDCLGIEGGNQDTVMLLSLFVAETQGNAYDRSDIIGGWGRYQAHFTSRMGRILVPTFDTFGQVPGTGGAEVFAVELVVGRETGIDRLDGACSCIHAHNGAGALGGGECQRFLGIGQKRLDRGGGGGIAHKQAYTNGFVV